MKTINYKLAVLLVSLSVVLLVSCGKATRTSPPGNTAAIMTDSAESRYYAAKARAAYRQKDYQGSAAYLRLQLLAVQKKYPGILAKLSRVYFNLGLANLKRNHYKAASVYFELGRPLASHIHGKAHRIVARYNSNLGYAYLRSGQFKQAVAPLKIAVAIKKRLHGKDSPKLINDYARLRVAFARLGDREQQQHYAGRVQALKSAYMSSR